MCFCFGSTSGHCMNVCDNILFPFFFFLKLSTCCLCLALSVLHQSSPMMNVEKNVKKYCDTFSLYLITFHESRRRIWAPVTYYLPPCSAVVHILLPPFCGIQCSILSESGRGENISSPCLLRRFYLEFLVYFLNSLNSVLFSRLWKSFCITLFEWCMCWNNKCIRCCQMIWALSGNLIWQF